MCAFAADPRAVFQHRSEIADLLRHRELMAEINAPTTAMPARKINASTTMSRPRDTKTAAAIMRLGGSSCCPFAHSAA